MNLGDIELPTDAVSARVPEPWCRILRGEVIMKNGESAMEGPLNLNNNRIVRVNNNDAANKQYVDGLIPDLTPYIKKADKGDVPLKGILDLNNQRIVNLDPPVDSNEAANKLYVARQIRNHIFTIMAQERWDPDLLRYEWSFGANLGEGNNHVGYVMMKKEIYWICLCLQRTWRDIEGKGGCGCRS